MSNKGGELQFGMETQVDSEKENSNHNPPLHNLSSQSSHRRDLSSRTSQVQNTRTESLLTKVHKRSEQLRIFFELPKGESLLEEFHCALAKTLLLQGRMYVFEQYLCFHSNIFGIIKTKVIAMKRVKSLQKKRHYGFPNSIDVVHGEGSKEKLEFFTSFISRDEAFNLLLTTWKQSQEKDQTSSSWDLSPAEFQDMEVQQSQHDKYNDRPEEAECEFLEGDILVEEQWSFSAEQPPHPHASMQIIQQQHFKTTSKQFARQVFFESSDIFLIYHDSRGHRNLQISPWKNHQTLGQIRELIFVTPLSHRIGPSEATCSQIQRARFYKDDYLIFETSQVMADIPYGDYFKVETRWDVQNVGHGECKVTVWCHVPFSKKTLVRKIIETSTIKEIKQGVQEFFLIIKNREQIQQDQSFVAESCDSESHKIQQRAYVQTKKYLHGQNENSPVKDGHESNSTLPLFFLACRIVGLKLNLFIKENSSFVLLAMLIFTILFCTINSISYNYFYVKQSQQQSLHLINAGQLRAEIDLIQQKLELLTYQAKLLSQEICNQEI
eukprot:TRINITY_DN2982_c1_g1_i1.p1 TRINITY_DN2982_c1_g1~~TRINITY_DN2982_c1_g1_i1.p1  ORF type:complete len:551 (-),score=59.77 TRINITY_DN2982_c1_g1_i1:659-2311(-)